MKGKAVPEIAGGVGAENETVPEELRLSEPSPKVKIGKKNAKIVPENTPNVQDEANESIKDRIQKILDNPNDNPQASISQLKRAQELDKEYEGFEVKYYCNICPDFSTVDPSTLIEHHCSFHEPE